MHLLGYDKLLVAEREFVRLGCVYKHTSKGLQQKMLFLFNDLLLITSKTSSDGEVSIVISASNEREFSGWWECLSSSIAGAGDVRTDLDTQLNDYEIEMYGASEGSTSGGSSDATLTYTQLSGYLLRKFKNSHGWQKLWVVFAMYSVSAPSPGDGIEKEYVFKLQYKTHVYFFRADSHFTYNRWVDFLQTPMLKSHHN
ncbi:unnamed protein product [Leptidea sinapis]|uniref:PH domain-containing protein n=1 Tax=Leptidea sinapis TaxID=189913 RepID=A0A5E4QEW4_9NEOP|nr:unnamed protein product [Leptidea sinapis]